MNKNVQIPKIAVVGMGAHFPGARNVKEFWQNILDKKDCIQEVPNDFWDYHDYYDANPFARDKTYCKYGGFLPAVLFDALEFGIPPKTLEAISLNQLLALLVAKEALTDARVLGPDPIEFDRSRLGVVLGANLGGNAFPLRERVMLPKRMQDMLSRHGVDQQIIDNVKADIKDGYVEWSEDSFPGFLANIVSSRIVNRFDFGGPNFTVDAACASSHCALSQALQELYNGNCDIMLTGGVNVSNDPLSYLSFSKTPALSLKNKIRPYDKDADGTLVGDGVGMLVLMRLEDAEAQGMRIYAVVRGLGSASDGKAKSIYAPRKSGQVQALHRAYEMSGLSPAEVGLVEGHGTGTPVGDVCEIEALKEAFDGHSIAPQSVALGSVKSQIGHTTQASGAASAIKAALALYHKILPPTINVDTPNPSFELQKSPFYINRQARPWLQQDEQKARIAAVSSFGFGGVNYHLLLEEYKVEHKTKAAVSVPKRVHTLGYSLLIAAPDVSQLLNKARQLEAKLESRAEFDDVAHLLEEYNSAKPAANMRRVGLVAADVESLQSKLKAVIKRLESTQDEDASWQLPEQISYRRSAIDPQAKVVAMFSSQGAQYANMGYELALHYPEMREAFSAIDQHLVERYNKEPLTAVYFSPQDGAFSAQQQHRLNNTEYVQPALAALCVGYYQLLQQRGFSADMFLGHSFGELTALWAAGAVSTQDFYKMSIARGLAMQASTSAKGESGSMLAVSKPPANYETLIDGLEDIYVANHNSPDQLVLSGSTQSIRRAHQIFSEQEIRSVELPVSGAFHSPFMQAGADNFASTLEQIKFTQPKRVVYANVDAQAYSKKTSEYAGYLTKQILQPVLFKQSLQAAYDAGGRIFIEIGPKSTLSTFARATLTSDDVEVFSVNANAKSSALQQLLATVMQMRVLGLELDRDPYEPELGPAAKPSKLAVRLHGRHHFTEESIKKMSNAGRDVVSEKSKSEISVAQSRNSVDQQAPKTIAKASVDTTAAVKPNSLAGQQAPAERSVTAPGVAHGSSQSSSVALDDVMQCQASNNQVQSQFYQTQAQQMAVLEKLLERQQHLAQQVPAEQVAQVSSEHMQAFEALCQQSQNMFAAHDAFLNNQNAILSRLLGQQDGLSLNVANAQAAVAKAVQSTPTHAVATNAIADLKTAAPSAPSAEPQVFAEQASVDTGLEGVDAEQLLNALMNIVSESTGYPQDVIDLDMDLEADLGIDSIKRVEIFSNLNDQFPQYSQNIEISDLASLATIQEIIDYFSSLLSSASIAPSASAESVAPLEQEQAVASEVSNTKADSVPAQLMSEEHFSKLLVNIITDVTGYPEDVIDFSMDLEADLGIDSIKRVEMFSVLQDEYGEILNNLDPSELMQLTTLQQIIDFFISFSNTEEEQNDEDNETGDLIKKPQAGTLVSPHDHAENKQALKKKRNLATALRYNTRVRAVDLPNSLGLAYPNERHVLLIDDGSSTAIAIAIKLQEQGYKTSVLVIKELAKNIDQAVHAPSGVHVFESSLSDLDDSGVKQLLDAIIAKYGPITGFLHVNPIVEQVGDIHALFEGFESQLLKSVFFFAKHLKLLLLEHSDRGRSFFCVITRIDGQFYRSGSELTSVLQGGYSGLIKTLKMEAPKLFCRTLDLAPELQTEMVSQVVVQELLDSSDKYLEVARTGIAQRFIIDKLEAELSAAEPVETIAADNVFLVSGGGRGITADCVVHLAQQYAGSYILVGRTALADKEPEWARGVVKPQDLRTALLAVYKEQGKKLVPAKIDKEVSALLVQREIRTTLNSINEAGARAIYLNADLSDAEQVKDVIEQGCDKFGSITALIHGAGNLADKLIENKVSDDFDLVYQSKVQSLANIMRYLDVDSLKYCMLFSSISGFYGQIAQADYALSNEVLNAVAAVLQARYPEIKVRAIGWGPWDGGMVAPALKRIYKKFNLQVMPVEEGVEFFVNELLHQDDAYQVLICPKNIDEVRSGLMQGSRPKLSL